MLMRYHVASLLLFVAAGLACPTGANGADQRSSPELAEAMRQLAEGHESHYRQRIVPLCQAGNIDAQIAHGRYLISKREYDEAERWLSKAASASSAEGQYSLGFLYLQVTPQRLTESRSWMEKASNQGHAMASAVMQLFERRARVGPSNQLSVMDILEGAALLGRLKTQAMSQHDVRCTGHTPEAFQGVVDASSASCIKEIHSAFGDWVAPMRSKEVGTLWGQCVNREILKPTRVEYVDYARCLWSAPTSP
jgi:TPR repeat protein